MTQYTYLIIGGGMTGEAAVKGVRSVDRNGSIGMISAEDDPPYKRPPLSKGLWKNQALDSIWYKTEAEMHLGRTVNRIDPPRKRVVDGLGVEYGYEKLLLATGGSPRRLPFDDGTINYFRTVEDYRRLRADTASHERFAVIGGGFIGSELGAALAMNDKDVSMIFPGEGICSHVLPRDLSQFLNDYYREQGVGLLTEATVTGMERREERFVLKVAGEKDGGERDVPVDGVVAGIGITPNTELAQQAGLDVENGIIVDEFLRTSQADIFAAGDAAAFVSPALGKRVRVEHEDNAKTMGRIAGQNMAGELMPYDHLPFFYSDLFDLGYEAVGELDARTDTVSDWKEPYRKGVVYYLREGRVSGVLLWNVWNQVDAARRLIAEPGPFRPEDLRGRLAEDRG